LSRWDEFCKFCDQYGYPLHGTMAGLDSVRCQSMSIVRATEARSHFGDEADVSTCVSVMSGYSGRRRCIQYSNASAQEALSSQGVVKFSGSGQHSLLDQCLCSTIESVSVFPSCSAVCLSNHELVLRGVQIGM